MAPYLEAATPDLPVSFLIYPQCGHGGDLIVLYPPYYSSACEEYQQRVIRLLGNHPEIRIVVMASAWSNQVYLPFNLKRQYDPVGLDAAFKVLETKLSDAIAQSASPGRKILLLADAPQANFAPVSCFLATSGLWRRPCPQTAITRAFFESYQRREYNVMARIAAARDDVEVVFPGDALCGEETCQMTVDGELLYRDGGHLRRNLSPPARRDFAGLIGLTAAIGSLVKEAGEASP
jgi:hypothetical protein